MKRSTLRRPEPKRPIFPLPAIPLLLAGLLLTLLCVGTPALAAGGPPRELHLVGDHWTAWEPPATAPEGAEVYTIERGDTLWDLAARFYKDPYLWPQLWERNQYILDAHWIYPGDPLVVSLEISSVETLAELGEEGEGEGEEGLGLGSNIDEMGILKSTGAKRAPVPLGSESDIYCSGFIGPPDKSFPYRIIGSEYGAILPTLHGTSRRGYHRNLQGVFGITDTTKFGLDTGDIVYLDGGRERGLEPGQLYTAVSPRQKIFHPLTGKLYGRLYRYQGQVRILSAQETTAIGEIVHSCDAIRVGDTVELFEPEPVPLARQTPLWPINLPTDHKSLEDAPVVLYAQGDVYSLGQDNVVYIDRGENDDILPGDIYTIYRANREGLPPMVIGELGILTVRERSAVAKILKSRYTVYLGDQLYIK
jgi:hypothetical protein